MCMIGRTILIQGEARKNKSLRKKYFVLSTGPNYTNPRLDHFPSISKWNEHKDDICDNIADGLSFRSIDLQTLFFVDDVYRSRPKHGGLDLYMEDRHVTIILSSDELKRKWREVLDNVVYKNGKRRSYPKIEHTLQVSVRLKPKENIDKGIISLWKGNFRACFTKMSLIFVDKSLDSPNFTMQYPFIRQWESRFDGTFRLEIGRAALIGECILILQLSDYAESKAAHSMLTNCIKCFKMSRPEPPRLRSSGDKSSNRNSSNSYGRHSSLGKISSTCGASKPELSSGLARDLYPTPVSQVSTAELAATLGLREDSNYLSMDLTPKVDVGSTSEVQNYFEHVSRIYKCPSCGHFTKVITFCYRCTSSSSASSLRALCKTEAFSAALKSMLIPSMRGKAQSLTEKSTLHPLSLRTSKPKLPFSGTSRSSQTSSKTSTNETSSGSKLESQNSLSISANRHDDDIFMELDFDNLETRPPAVRASGGGQGQPRCGNCLLSLVHRGPVDSELGRRCAECCEDLLSLSVPVEEARCGPADWIPRTTSLVPGARPPGPISCDYEEVGPPCLDPS